MNMKKLITILFLIPFLANAQIELSEDYSFTKDKKLHTYIASGGSALVYTGVYVKTKDAGLAFRAGIIIPAFPIIIWEGVRMFSGKEISLGDMGYGLGSAFVTSGLMYIGTKLLEKRKQKKMDKLLDVSFLPDLKNEPLVKK